MNKKKLPKAIIQTNDASLVTWGSDAGGLRLAPQTDAEKPTLETHQRATPQQAQATSNVVPINPSSHRVSPAPSASLNNPAVPSPALVGQARRRKALTIVNRHAAYSAAGGLIPLPVANFAGVTAIIVRMVQMLSGHYGVPFRRDRARAIVVGIVGGALPSGAATLTSSVLFTMVPPSMFMAAAASSMTAAAFTRSVGRLFVEHFESGATLDEFTATATK